MDWGDCTYIGPEDCAEATRSVVTVEFCNTARLCIRRACLRLVVCMSEYHEMKSLPSSEGLSICRACLAYTHAYPCINQFSSARYSSMPSSPTTLYSVVAFSTHTKPPTRNTRSPTPKPGVPTPYTGGAARGQTSDDENKN